MQSELVAMEHRLAVLEMLVVQILGQPLTEEQLESYSKCIPWRRDRKELCQLGNGALLAFKEQRVCGTCQYFGPSLAEDHTSRGSKNTTFHKCTVNEHDDCFDPVQGEGAVVQDGSGYHAKLCVEAEFACIKWQKKQAEIIHHAV